MDQFCRGRVCLREWLAARSAWTERRDGGWRWNVLLCGGRENGEQTHLPDFVRTILSVSPMPMLVKYSVLAVELHVGGTKAGSQEVQCSRAADACWVQFQSLARTASKAPRRKLQ